MAHSNKEPFNGNLPPLSLLLHCDAGQLLAAQQLCDFGIEDKLHIFFRRQGFHQLCLAPEAVSPVDEIDLAAGLGEKHGVLKGAVAAAVDRHRAAFIESTVAHGTKAYAAADQFLLPGEAQHTGLRSGGNNHCPGLEFSPGEAFYRFDFPGSDGNNFLQLHLCALLHGLLQKAVAQLGAADGDHGGKVFHLGRPGDLAAEGIFFDHKDRLARPPCVCCGR